MDLLSVQVPYHLAQGVRHHELPPLLRLTAFSPGPDAGSGLLKMSLEPGRGQNPREDAEKAWAYLKDHCPGFKESHIAECGEVLDREGPRLLGDYQLTEEDVLSARKFPDGIVKNAWPIELWDPRRGPTYQYLEPGEYYEIPGRCLKTRAVSNVLCTGRCISVTHRALGSTRVMGTCMALGEAAGGEGIKAREPNSS
jgi:hypothetical protein